MFLLSTTAQRYTCKKADAKPTAGIKQGSACIETDTGKQYIFDGTAWAEQTGTTTLVQTAVSVGAVTTAVLAANADRKYALLVNDSDAVIYIAIGAAAALNAGIRLNAGGGSYEMYAANGNLDTRAINAITASAGKILLVTEGE